MNMERKNGFTLLEILVVLAIIGILIGIFGVNYIQSIRRANLNEAATTAFSALYRARSLSQRGSTDQPVTWTANTINAGTGRSMTLPNGAVIVTAPVNGYVYTAPYGELTLPSGMEGLRLEIKDSTGQYHTAIDLLGVTGKVMRRRVVKMAEAIN